MGQIWSTEVVAPRQQFDFWRDAICDVFVQLEAERDGGGEFVGRIAVDPLADLVLSDLTSDPQQVSRTRRQIARAREEVMLVSLQLEGEGLIRQDGRQAWLKPGDFAMYDSTRPYQLQFDGRFRQLVLHMPRHCLASRLAQPQAMTARPISGASAIGAITGDFLRSVARRAGALDAGGATDLSGHVVDLLAFAIGATAAAESQGAAAARAALLQRIRTYMEINLADPSLGPVGIARAHHISVRHLYALFAAGGSTVGDWLRRRRLARCRAALRDPAQQRRSVTEIAYNWGFNDAAHFSRCYRREYGIAPSEERMRF